MSDRNEKAAGGEPAAGARNDARSSIPSHPNYIPPTSPRQDPARVIVQLLAGTARELLPLAELPEPWRGGAELIAAAEDRMAAYEHWLASLDGRGITIRATVERAAIQVFAEPDVVAEAYPAALASDGTWLPEDQVLEALRRHETGDAELLAALYAGRIAYDHAEDAWYLWNGVHWEQDRRVQAVRLVSGPVASQYLHTAAELRQSLSDDAENNEEAVRGLVTRAGKLRFRSRISNVLALARSQPVLALNGEEWDSDPWLLGVANGVIDLRDGTFRPGRPADYIRTVAPTTWQGLETPAPRWDRFLNEIFAADQDLIQFIQRLLGYAITGLNVEHVLVILWGEGRNGKDTLLELLAHVLGDLASPVGKEVLLNGSRTPNAATPYLYALRPLRIAWVNETNEGARLDAGQVKYLTGGGRVTARPLYGKPVTFAPHYLLMLVTNYKPHASADDYAIWTRLRVIPFTQAFVDRPDPAAANEHRRDPHLVYKLRAEASGILAWLVCGCLAWQREGLSPPHVVQVATDAYREEEDVIGQFLTECCVRRPEATVRAAILYATYVEWAREYGQRPMSNATFGKRLAKRKIEKKRQRHGNAYLGIGLLAQQDGDEGSAMQPEDRDSV